MSYARRCPNTTTAVEIPAARVSSTSYDVTTASAAARMTATTATDARVTTATTTSGVTTATTSGVTTAATSPAACE